MKTTLLKSNINDLQAQIRSEERQEIINNKRRKKKAYLPEDTRFVSSSKYRNTKEIL